ncbi:5-oxoprolinase subunit B [Neolewinella maritima]|uniref:5-oxoprolinase subunit B n=1 Tax=Neolewinella maritima TaxID=1383882 RepID=A0ABM9B3V1_9BACT|nr:5-oxoprolinase subunit PxpB [Neolewinella maritima]CAH1001923.1 5-oxoprolinase subunit B [Neolewinella maritima]
MQRRPRYIRPFGTTALLLEWEQRIDPEISRSVTAYGARLRTLPGVTECVPAYASLLVCIATPGRAVDEIREAIYDLDVTPVATTTPFLHRLPVCYDLAFGPDLPAVAEHADCTTDEVIRRHTGRSYLVYFLGYQPGFGFLGEVAAGLEVPRRVSPRTRVPAGSVGLAGRQTGIYPTASAGGWQLIGGCPLPMLRCDSSDVTRLRAGDRVEFYAVTQEEYAQLQHKPLPWPQR